MLPGPSVIKEFETVLSNHCQKEYAIATCNASVGILGVFWALGLQNQEVITTPLTWPGAIAGLMALNCKVKYCNIEPDFLTIDPASIKKMITPKTKAVFSADFLGYPCQLDKIKKVCEENNLILIHDAASSFCSNYKGYQSGYFADVSIYSFGSKKLFSLGEGGAIVLSSDKIYEKILHTVSHPERQQIEFDKVNPFSLNISMNLLAAEFGLEMFNQQVNYVKYRAEVIEGYLKDLLKNKQEAALKPNYHNILLKPKEILNLPAELKNSVKNLPIEILNIQAHLQRMAKNNYAAKELNKFVSQYRILSCHSFII